MSTGIEWTGETWNPVRGCSLVSDGCVHCYAMKQAHRFSGPGQPYEGLTRMRAKGGPVWTGEVRPAPPHILIAPINRKKPQTYFVNSMSDLFHDDVASESRPELEYILLDVLSVIAMTPRHTYQVLTKRAESMHAFMTEPSLGERIRENIDHWDCEEKWDFPDELPWPLPNLWLGVSVENQAMADERIPLLMDTPAAIRWLSVEPLLEAVDLAVTKEPPDWVVVGGESGPGARACSVDWIRSIVADCRAADVPVFVKQLGARYVDAMNGIGGKACRPDPQMVPPIRHLADRKGGDMSEWPADLRVRQFPATQRAG